MTPRSCSSRGSAISVALEALATRRGRDLEAEGVSIVPIGGAHAVGPHLERYGPRGLDLKLAGLCDVGEEGAFLRGLERAGMGTDLTREDMEELGFFVCVTDLEDELVRALGSAAVLQVIEAAGRARAVRTFQKQPRSASSAWTSSSGASCGTGRSATRRCSWTRSISTAFRVRSTAC